MTRSPVPPLRALLPALAVGETFAVSALFDGMPPDISFPFATSHGREGLDDLVNGYGWLGGHEVTVEPGPTWGSGQPGELLAHEATLTPREGRPFPILLVAEVTELESLGSVRAYHSTWPLTGEHRVRPPLLPPAGEPLELGDPFASYHRALSVGDAAGVRAVFTEDGYLREPAGDDYRHTGADRDRLFEEAFAGGVGLALCTFTDAGQAQFIEFVCDRIGTAPITPTAGAAVYENDGQGRIVGARIYDDASTDAVEHHP